MNTCGSELSACNVLIMGRDSHSLLHSLYSPKTTMPCAREILRMYLVEFMSMCNYLKIFMKELVMWLKKVKSCETLGWIPSRI